MMSKQFIKKLVCFIVLVSIHGFSFSQEEKRNPEKWRLSVEIGLGTSSTYSEYSKLLAPNYSLGVIREWKSKKKLIQAIQLKYNIFTETFGNLPYYYLDNGDHLVSTTFDKRNSYHMLYLGWAPRYEFNQGKYFIQGGIGFNYIFLSYSKRIFDGGTGTSALILPPNNYFANRPELSLGFGYNLKIKESTVSIIPKYTYSFIVGSPNYTPSFHSFRLEITYTF